MTDPLGLISTQGPQAAAPGRPAHAPRPTDGPSFKDVLMGQIDEVNRMQADTARAIEDLSTGKRDMEQVMMAQQKAEIAFQLLLQVRNKMMDAYEEVKQIRV